MKTFICLVLFALVATTYTAPARSSMNQAEAQFWRDLLKKVGKGALKVAPHVLDALGGGAEMQDEDDDDLANIETLFSQRLQNRAEVEGFMDILKTIGKGAMKVAPYALDVLGGGAEMQDEDDDDLANIEALLNQRLQERAEIEGFMDILKKIGKGAGSVLKGAAPFLKTGLHLVGKK